MRKLGLTFALVFAAAPLAAQGMPWKHEIGLNLNYTVTTVNDQDITVIGFPSASGYASIGGLGGAYGIIPINERFAVEPSVGFSDINLSNGGTGGSVTTGNFSARLLYSISGGFYVGGGPALDLVRTSGQQASAWGFNVGAGYRRDLTGSLTGRAEVYYESMGENELIGNETSSSIGLKLGLGITPDASNARGRGRSDALWRRSIGFQGGYSHVTTDAGNEIGIFSIPGADNAIVAGNSPIPGTTPLFVQFPLGERLVVEPSFGYSSTEVEGSGKASSYSVGVRVNYAFNKTFYAGAGYDYVGFGGDLDLDASTGYGVQGGIRFPLMGAISGRTEVSWRQFSADDALLSDYNNAGISFAVIAPID